MWPEREAGHPSVPSAGVQNPCRLAPSCTKHKNPYHLFDVCPLSLDSQRRGTARTLPHQLLFVLFGYLCCSMYCLCVNVYCHRLTTQLQLINVSYHSCVNFTVQHLVTGWMVRGSNSGRGKFLFSRTVIMSLRISKPPLQGYRHSFLEAK